MTLQVQNQVPGSMSPSASANRRQKDLEFLRGFLEDKLDDGGASKKPGNCIKPSTSISPNKSRSWLSNFHFSFATCTKSSSQADNKSTTPKARPIQTSQAKKSTLLIPKCNGGRNCARCILLDVPLVMLFLSLSVVYCMRTIYNTYYVPILERAKRTDEDLELEFTYYGRACSLEDFTTDDFLKGLLPSTPTESVDFIMRHGATVFPDLLSPLTVVNLRKFIRHKSHRISQEEVYPMSQGENRMSYGIEATEDEAVVQALNEITSNKLLAESLKRILGTDDPALTELTQITAYYGCDDQVIHSDTKAEGSGGYAGTNARTYAHSYSLFIPLVDVTEVMGVTQICPGTHYCANDLFDICSENKIGVGDLFEDKVWHAGAGTLINQQVWHGGSAHKDRNAPERILFIVSFIAPPRLGIDPRQLARGTYFHQKWLMWGHTWKDIALDSSFTASWPFNAMRSLALWKPPNRNWGYDLLLAASLRAANNQLGMEADDLETFIDLKMNKFLPNWLQGSFSYSENAWQVYIKETLDNTFDFLRTLNAAAHVFYLLMAIIISRTRRKIRFQSVLKRVIITHGVVACLSWGLLWGIRHSEWGSNILSGYTFMRPFPGEGDITSYRWETDPSIPMAATTLPERMDVLFGSRYDAKYLGSYNNWLSYHPGNLVFRKVVSERCFLYAPDSENATVLLHRLVADVVNQVEKETSNGRFLRQDHTTGSWVIMSKGDTLESTMLALATESQPLAKALNEEINFLVAEYRFDHLRGSALAVDSTMYLNKLRKRLVGSYPVDKEKRNTEWTKTKARAFRPTFREPLTVAQTIVTLPQPKLSQSAASDGEKIKVGTTVMCYFSIDDFWQKGTVKSVNVAGSYDVSFVDGSFEENVSIRRLRKPLPLSEGVRVVSYVEVESTQFGATVVAVYPSGKVDLAFDNGDFYQDVEEDEYEISYPPF